MGGPGSGRLPWRLSVEECRALDIGELCDAGRRHTRPRGEVLWRAQHGSVVRARLAYVISGQEGADDELSLTYRYWPEGTGTGHDDGFALEGRAGRRSVALCPGCGRWVRRLYAPPRQTFFRCRDCYGLVYRRSQILDSPAHLSEVAGPILRELRALPQRTRHKPRRTYVEHPPAELARRLEAELSLQDQELRLWCLRLRACGLSYRQIAALTESSKSSVQRICAAGRGGIDVKALVSERLERAYAVPAMPQGDDPRALGAYLSVLHRRSLRLGLYRQPLSDPEERQVIPSDGVSES